MINFQLGPICLLLRRLQLEEQEMTARVSLHDAFGGWPASDTPPKTGLGLLSSNMPQRPMAYGMTGSYAKAAGGEPSAASMLRRPFYVTDEDKKRISSWLEFAKTVCTSLFMSAALHRVDLFSNRLATPMKGADFVADVRALREAIEGDSQAIYFHHYEPVKVAELLAFKDRWAPILEKFKTAEKDAWAAIHCWAIGQGTACVFHMMRVAEYGLRALAKERRVVIKNRPIEWATWEAVITAIETKVRQIASRKAGKARGAALDFYSGALGEFTSFKDVYRNNVMHTRDHYDPDRAKSVMLQVREFMFRLSQKIGDDPKAIRWGKMP